MAPRLADSVSHSVPVKPAAGSAGEYADHGAKARVEE